jgi:hypothetical protein
MATHSTALPFAISGTTEIGLGDRDAEAIQQISDSMFEFVANGADGAEGLLGRVWHLPVLVVLAGSKGRRRRNPW